MRDVTPNRNGRNERLIQELAADLAPVKRLRRPVWRACLWLGVVVAIAAVLALFSDLSAVTQRLTAAPDMWLAAFGSTLTAVLAAVATFQLSIPDRSPMWGLLPMPAALLWVGASGVGCLRTWIVPEMQDASLTQSEQCLLFILGLSIPLSVLLFTMLRRAYTLRPNLAAAIGGLSVAAASATLLTFFHPYDTTWTDLIVHVIAVAIVVITNWTFAGRLIDDKKARLHA